MCLAKKYKVETIKIIIIINHTIDWWVFKLELIWGFSWLIEAVNIWQAILKAKWTALTNCTNYTDCFHGINLDTCCIFFSFLVGKIPTTKREGRELEAFSVSCLLNMLTKKERWLFYCIEGNLSPKQRILCTWRNLCGESAILIIHIKSVTLKWNDFNRNEKDQNFME